MDYKQLGLKIGLEIHQQVNSGTKLFCNCPIKKSEEFPLEVRRRLRPVQSEMGEDDPAALYEFLKNRIFVYKINTESSCLIELDEAPPLSVNQKALRTSIQLSRMLHCTIVDEVHFMRKTVIDGSAVTGFQRTALLATDGFIDTSFGPLKIQSINLEEDSAPAFGRGEQIEYRLDRLGVPLVEIATDSTIATPEQAKEAAEKIGTLLRSLEVVRGIGSIRQDINISIREGNRIEIKGFQELDKIPMVVENEIARQVSLVEIKNELQRRGFHGVRPLTKDVTKTFHNTQCNFVKKAIDNNQRVYGLLIPKFSDLLRKMCGDKTFGKELSYYPGAYGFGITHSDEELEKYKLTQEFLDLRKEFGAKEEDLVLIVVGNKCERAINALIERINYCLIGVPKETRIADGEGSRYARPLPGSGRMYPESDVPAIRITPELLSVELPKTLEEKKAELDIPEQMADQIVRSSYFTWFETLKKYDAVLAANIFISFYTDLRRRGFDVDKIKIEELEKIMQKISENIIPKNSVSGILEALCSDRTIDSALSDYYLLSEEQITNLIKSTIEENPEKTESAIIGIVLSKAKGRADGRKISEMVKQLKQI